MRWLAVLALVVAAPRAHAKRVIQVPSIELHCSTGRWEQIDKCVRRFGTVTMAYQDARTKLLRVGGVADRPGLYAYHLWDGIWRLGAHYPANEALELVATKPVAFGIRFDLAESSHGFLPGLDDEPVAGVVARRWAWMCGGTGDNWQCYAMSTACDGFVRGKAVFSFRGSVVATKHALSVTGDVTKAGTACRPALTSVEVPS